MWRPGAGFVIACALALTACNLGGDFDGQGGAGGSETGAGGAGGGGSGGSPDGPGGQGGSGVGVGGSGAGGAWAQDLTPVSHPREFRAAWVATVNNINFPSKTGLSAADSKAELTKLVATLEKYNLNAIVFQVRPECDALYESKLEPWSRFLTGTQGKGPGYDPLAHLVEEAHARNIEVHAWFNPYRAKVSSTSTAVAPHASITYAKHAHKYGSALWMDPGADEVRQHTLDVIVDVVKRYDIDGVHFDDYFYPYPVDGATFDDAGTYAAYKNSGGTLSKGDWRRDNVNRLVREVSKVVAAEKDWVRWGISPFGIYRPGQPPGIVGLDPYEALYADAKLWVEKRWLDYIAPQLYWKTTQVGQEYGKLLPWWSALSKKHDRNFFAGNFLSKLGEPGWTLAEFKEQIDISRDHRDENSLGNIWYQIAPLVSNKSGIGDMMKKDYYGRRALTPRLVDAAGVTAPPFVKATGTSAEVEASGDEPLRAFVVYEQGASEGAWKVKAIVPAPPGPQGAPVTLDLGAAGTYAISAAAKNGLESEGVRVVVP